MKKVFAAISLSVVLMYAGAAKADRIQLPDDPDITLSIGSGGFFGKSKKVGFERIQPTFLRLEAAVFKAPKRRWFNRMNAFCAVSPEFANISYKGQLKQISVEDEDGETYEVQEDGLKRADLSANMNGSGGCGFRVSIYDHPRFHLDVFGEFARSFRSIPTNPDVVLVSWSGLELNVADLARENADIRLNWYMGHAGFTFGMPMRPWKNHQNLRLTPFLIAGFLHFNADININVDPEFIKTLENLGIDPEIIPKQKGIDINNVTASVGARLDIGLNHALETTGSFFFTRAGTRVYWATFSYSLRFDIW